MAFQDPNSRIRKIETACPDGFLTLKNRPSPCLWAGLIGGVVVILVSEMLGYLDSGHRLNDPILMTRIISAAFQGFLYFNWPGFLVPLFFSMMEGVFAWVLVFVLTNRKDVRLLASEAKRVAIITAVIGILPVLFREVDGFQVLLWYGIALYFAVLVARLSAGWTHTFFQNLTNRK